MNKVSEIVNYLNNWAKTEYQESWDNSGNQIYFENEEIESVIVAMDVFDEIIDIAIEERARLIITHHPMIFSPIKSIDDTEYMGKNIIKAIKNNISIYSAHTTLDVAKDGVNDCLCDFLKLKNVEDLAPLENGFYLGKIGTVEEIKLEYLLNKLKVDLKVEHIKLYGKKIDTIKKIALCGGSGTEFIDTAVEKNADVFITGDVKYHDGQRAYEKGIMVIDIGHYDSEKLIVDKIKTKLEQNFDLKVHDVYKNNYEITIEDI